jgi:hypothetical protein
MLEEFCLINVYNVIKSCFLHIHPLILLFVPNLEHRAPFGVYVITHTIRHTVGLLWTSDQPVAEASTGQHNI